MRHRIKAKGLAVCTWQTASPQRVKKVFDFFARFKNATFFVKTGFHEKSRYARQKA